VQLAVTPTLRDAEVDLHSGVAFSKVGLRLGEKEDYQVHTSFGVVSAHGTDFATVALPERVDVWVALGTVRLISPDGEGAKSQSVTAEARGPVKVMRYPVAKDAQAALMESAETLSSALMIIPMINQKLKILSDRVTGGGKLTPREADYMGRIRKVASLIKLTFVPPPTPPPVLSVPKPVTMEEPKHAPKTTPVESTDTTAAASATTAYVDPNSLVPKKTMPKKSSDTAAESAGDSVPAVRHPKVSLDLRDQDNSSSNSTAKPVANGPNDTVP
jgi:hypothetical protein